MEENTSKKENFFQRIVMKCKEAYEYAETGVWHEERNTFWIRCVKVFSLSVRTFFNRDLQTQASSLTYSTVLAIVPALALLFAIARGFGFQNLVHDQIFRFLPSQRQALDTAFSFVDSYLNQASQGIFVGVGIVVLLWTVISLLSSIEDSFNSIWGIKQSRTIYRKITDYLTVCILIPVLMVCSSGISIFIAGINDALNIKVIGPVVNLLLELSPLFLTWLAFTLTFFLMPNGKVSFKYSAISGVICMIGFQILQYLFMTGQIYVSKYNAIYGSFAFLPLMLVWMQFSWLIILFGCLLTFSMQNVNGFNYLGSRESVARNYYRKIVLAFVAILTQNSLRGKNPMTLTEIASVYRLPITLLSDISSTLIDCGLLYKVQLSDDAIGLAPAFDIHLYSVGELFNTLNSHGNTDFIPFFNSIFGKAISLIDSMVEEMKNIESTKLIMDIPVPTKEEILEKEQKAAV